MQKTRLGIIGCGWIAPAHRRAIEECSDRCTLEWAVDPDLERATAIAAQSGGRALTEYKDVLDEVDAVIVATPHHLHTPVALDLAQAGKHILMEKPLATTLEDADRMIAAASEAGVILMAGYTRHYQPQFRQLRQLVESGAYGRVLTLTTTMMEDVGGYVSGWLARRDQLGGGCFFSAGGHPLEWLVSLGGPVVDIHCLTERFSVAMDGEDTAAVVMRLSSGALATLTMSWCQPHTSAWMSVRAECTGGALSLSFNHMTGGPAVWSWNARLVAEVRHQEQILYEGPAGFEFTPQLAHFLDCVSGQTQPETGAQYARSLMAAILQAYAGEKG